MRRQRPNLLRRLREARDLSIQDLKASKRVERNETIASDYLTYSYDKEIAGYGGFGVGWLGRKLEL